MNKILLIISLGLLLSGCFHTKVKPEIVTEYIDTCLEPPKASPIVMRDIKFYDVRDSLGILWVAITPSDYAKMSINTSEILAHIKQKNAVKKYYVKCYEKKKVEEKK